MIVSHPIQYHSPWFAYLAGIPGLQLKVFYLWDFGVRARRDRDFGIAFRWNVPLLEGYEYEFVENVSKDLGTHHFRGLDNPSLVARVGAWKPDVILLFGYAYLSHLRLLLSAVLRHVPIILRGDSHNLGRQRGLRSIVTLALRKMAFRRIDAFLAVGRANIDYFLDCARDPEQIVLARHFVDNRRFQAEGEETKQAARAWRRTLGIADDVFVFGFVGKFEDKKRPRDLLTASECMWPQCEQGGRVRPAILFIGAGIEEARLRARAGDRVGKDVFFASFQNQSEMPRAYAALDVLVLPSGNNETWGLCVNEAMNLGVPAIVSDLVGCASDLVIPGSTGWIVHVGDTDGLRVAMIAALERTPEQRMEMAGAVQRHVAKYSVEQATEGLLKAIDQVLRKGHGLHAE